MNQESGHARQNDCAYAVKRVVEELGHQLAVKEVVEELIHQLHVIHHTYG